MTRKETRERLAEDEIAKLKEQIEQIQETCRRLTERLQIYEPAFQTVYLYNPKVTKL